MTDFEEDIQINLQSNNQNPNNNFEFFNNDGDEQNHGNQAYPINQANNFGYENYSGQQAFAMGGGSDFGFSAVIH